MGIINFLILDDLSTIVDPNSSAFEKALAGASITPVGKIVKIGGKLFKIVSKGSDEAGYFAKGTGQTVRMTSKEASEAAQKLGYQKTNYTSHGQPVFKKGNKYITLDVDQHSGGVWKMADSIRNLGRKNTRMGTYDADLKRIGD